MTGTRVLRDLDEEEERQAQAVMTNSDLLKAILLQLKILNKYEADKTSHEIKEADL